MLHLVHAAPCCHPCLRPMRASAFVREGSTYYATIQDKVNKLRMRAEDFKVARDYQKEELLGADVLLMYC